MARTRTFALKLDLGDLPGVSERLGQITAESLGIGAIEAVNEVTLRFDETARAGEIADINLSAAYVKSKTDLSLASNPANPRAEITTSGDLTILGRYAPLIQLRNLSTRSLAAGPRRGRPSGVRVQIKRSVQAIEPKWFTMRLRAGNAAGDNVGVFVRSSAKGGEPKHIYGPSPYSLFRHQIETRAIELEDDLAGTALKRFGELIGGSL